MRIELVLGSVFACVLSAIGICYSSYKKSPAQINIVRSTKSTIEKPSEPLRIVVPDQKITIQKVQ